MLCDVPGGQVCENGSCVCTGPDGGANGAFSLCSTCVDLQSDSRNCGECGLTCGNGTACQDGGCQ
jgi:hypothetical protein